MCAPVPWPRRAELLAQSLPLLLELVAQHRVGRVGHRAESTAGPVRASGAGRITSAAGPGVGGVVHRPQPLRRHLRVHLRRRQAGVAEQLLHDPDVGAVVEHVGGARVAQHVREQPVAEAGAVTGGPHDQPCALAGEPAAARVEEQAALGRARRALELGPAGGRGSRRARPARCGRAAPRAPCCPCRAPAPGRRGGRRRRGRARPAR